MLVRVCANCHHKAKVCIDEEEDTCLCVFAPIATTKIGIKTNRHASRLQTQTRTNSSILLLINASKVTRMCQDFKV